MVWQNTCLGYMHQLTNESEMAETEEEIVASICISGVCRGIKWVVLAKPRGKSLMQSMVVYLDLKNLDKMTRTLQNHKRE